MPDQSGDRSQEPTPHRRQKAREEGHVAQSQDLASAVLLIAAVLTLMMAGQALVDFLGRYTQQQLGGEAWLWADASFTVAHCTGVLWDLAKCLLPIFGLILLAAVLVHVGQIGFLFLPSRVSFDLTRLDPFQGLQRIFSLSNVVRLGFGLFKVAVVATVAAVALYQERNTILGLTALSLPEVAAYLIRILLSTTLRIGLALLVLAILDYVYQRWKHEKDLRMTPQEVREEMRNLEGDPQIAARRRVVQRQLAMSRMSQAVPKADVVVTNPTELAVAIQYEPETMAAPIVVAKGAGTIAQRIRLIALQNGIPIVERKPLAQALFREVEVNHPIPRDKYAAVAEVLAYVYQLKGKKIPAPARAA
jgi:flagellar biosynthetic protein FlhB